MKRLNCILGLCSVLCSLPQVNAAISVGANGVGPLTLETNPPATEFSTWVVPGAGSTFTTVDQVNALMDTFDAHRPIFQQLRATLGYSPHSAQAFQYNSSARLIYSYISSGPTNGASVLLATLQNDSDKTLESLVVSYDLGRANSSGPSEPLPGLYVYYSATGLPGSWRPIPELTANVVPGNHVATLDLGEWHDGDRMYLVWFDDNVPGMDDPGYTLDNFRIDLVQPPPVILSHPGNATNLVSRTVRLEVVAEGVGLTYQWHKVGVGPINPAINPSAATPTLVIANAQLSDTGDYFVIVSSPFGGTQSNNGHVQVNPDVFPPKLLAARASSLGLNFFELLVDEPVCTDFAQCGANATCTFNWEIVPIVQGFEGSDLVVEEVLVNGTNVTFRTTVPHQAGQQYRIKIVGGCDGGLNDVFGIQLAAGAPGSTIDTLPTAIFTATKDAEIHSGATADAALGQATVITIDNDDSGIARGLLAFENIFGNGPGQIPLGSLIVSATLRLSQADPGSPANFHRMVIDWDEATVTWNSMVDGVTNDGVEAVIASDALSPNEVPNGFIALNVTASVQAWANGQANHGWAILSTGTGGWDWETSESSNPPVLSVVYSGHCDGCQPVTISGPPSTIVVTEGHPLVIAVTVSNAFAATYQWAKNGSPIPGATGPTYFKSAVAAGPDGDSGTYRLSVTQNGVTITSSNSVVTVVPETSRPFVTGVNAQDPSVIAVTFNEPVSVGSGTNLTNYAIIGAPSVTLNSSVLSADRRTVTLTTAPRSLGGSYSLQIQNVSDSAATPNLINPNPTTIPLTTVLVIDHWNSTWSYNTNNQDATMVGTPWYSPAFDASSWPTGSALFGTETSAGIVAIFPAPIATTLLPNTNTAPEMITYYFRKQITLPSIPEGTTYVLNHFIDDGAIFWLDGVVIGRLNMTNIPPVLYAHRASTAGEAARLSTPFIATPGPHTLAVEVHQGGTTTSSDVLFGVQITAMSKESPSLSIRAAGTNAVLNWSADSSWALQTAHVVTGSYIPIATSGFGVHTNATAGNPTNLFFRLQYQP